MHADDANILASTRENAVSKLKSLLTYCTWNCIIPQYKKCEFIAINGDESDKEPLPFGETVLYHVTHLETFNFNFLFSEKINLHLW